MALTNKQLEEAIEEYDFYIGLDPRSDRTFCARGIAKYKLGKLEEALKDFDTAIELFSLYDEAYYLRGMVKKDLNRDEEAEQDFSKAIDLDSNVKDYVEAKLGRIEKE